VRRLLALLLAGVLLLPLTACRGNTEEPNTLPTTEEQTAAEPVKEDTTETETEAETEPEPVMPEYTLPAGTGIGVHPGRVTWAHHPEVFDWNGSGYWWLRKNYDEDIVRQMLTDSLCQLAGKENINDALDALFRDFNKRKTGEEKGYTAGEKIVIKANMNVTGNGDADNKSIGGYYPAPVTMLTLLKLLVEFGVAPEDITLIDPSRNIPTYIQLLLSGGQLDGIRFGGFNDDVEADTAKPIRWSHDFSEDNWPDYDGYATVNPTFWPECVTEATYMINLFNLRGHTLAGFTASAKNHFGTVMPAHAKDDGTFVFPKHFRTGPPSYSGIHHYVAALDYFGTPTELWDLPKRDMGTYSVLVDLTSNADAGGKTFLYLCDALAATLTQGSSLTLDEKWLSAPFGDGTKAGAGWPCSFFASQDPVAIDSVVLDFLLAEKAAAEAVGDTKWDSVLPDGHTADNSLVEAALADCAPSGTVYQDGYGNPVGSLGVHEHWNNAADKQYSRNLGKDEGIELIPIRY